MRIFSGKSQLVAQKKNHLDLRLFGCEIYWGTGYKGNTESDLNENIRDMHELADLK